MTGREYSKANSTEWKNKNKIQLQVVKERKKPAMQ